MLTIKQLGLRILLTAVPVLTLAGVAIGGDDVGETDDGMDVWFRDTDLEALTTPPITKYVEAEAGESALMERAWEGAPPSIPHTTRDMLPILRKENECVECHHPENVTSKKDKPLPDSHFEAPTLAAGAEGDPMVWKVTGYAKGDDVFGARWNCTMCHTPQAENVNTPATSFVSLVEEIAPEPEPEPEAAPAKQKWNKKACP